MTRHVPQGAIHFDHECARLLRKQKHAASLGITGFSENLDHDFSMRVYHALLQHPQPEDIERFGKLGVVIYAQPYSVISDGGYAEKRLGAKRCETTFPFRDIIDSGAILSFGSDSGGGDPSPVLGIYAAVTRATATHPDGWIPHQKITVEEVLCAYTYGTAYASFFEDQAGTLEVGKLADLVVLDSDILNIQPDRIRDVKVLLTLTA